jgi:hypothetical protein
MKLLHIALASTLALLIGVSVASAQKGRGDDQGLSRTGYVAQIKQIEGTLERIKIGPCAHTTGRAENGVHLFVRAENGTLMNWHLGPDFAVLPLLDDLEAGATVQAKAFQTEKVAQRQYIVKTLSFGATEIILRDGALKPMWSTRGQGRMARYNARN